MTRIFGAANQDETDLQRNITSFEQREDDSSRLRISSVTMAPSHAIGAIG